MTDAERLELLKADLQNPPAAKDTYLLHLLGVAAERIAGEGIHMTASVSDENLRIMYAAYLYRKRAAPETAMPRMLRYALNQRLFGKKEATPDAT